MNPVLLKLTGSSCGGKSTLMVAATDRLGGEVVGHDFDEVGVPPNAGKAWRHRHNEQWVLRVLEYQRAGRDVLLTGQSPLGELLATPSAPLLEGIAVCLIDVADDLRLERLRRRDGDRWLAEKGHALVQWGQWHRSHAGDPQFRQDVLMDGAWPDMVWSRWSAWTKADRRWSMPVIDTSHATVEQSTRDVLAWINRERALLAAGKSPLANGWDRGEAPVWEHDGRRR